LYQSPAYGLAHVVLAVLREERAEASLIIRPEIAMAKRHFFWRQNTAPAFDWKTKQFRRMPKYAMRGVPDIILVHVSRPYFLEVKRTGTYQSPEQRSFSGKPKRRVCR